MTSLSTLISSPGDSDRRNILVMLQIAANQIDENVVFIISF
jgi:hypothetical protein